MMDVINPRTGRPYPRRLRLAPNAELADVLRVLTDRHGSVDYEFGTDGDTDVVYYEVSR
jgi:hypothetical protein